MTAKLSGAARHDPRHVIEEQRTRLEEGRGSLTCSCSHVIERAISTLYGEDPFQPLRDAFVDHRREAGAGEPRPVRGGSGATFNPSLTDIQAGLFLLPPVTPSDRPIDLTDYQRQKREGVAMPSRFSRTHYR